MRAQSAFQAVHTVLQVAGSMALTSHSTLGQKESLPREKGDVMIGIFGALFKGPFSLRKHSL